MISASPRLYTFNKIMGCRQCQRSAIDTRSSDYQAEAHVPRIDCNLYWSNPLFIRSVVIKSRSQHLLRFPMASSASALSSLTLGTAVNSCSVRHCHRVCQVSCISGSPPVLPGTLLYFQGSSSVSRDPPAVPGTLLYFHCLDLGLR